jgi:hypothetical protein
MSKQRFSQLMDDLGTVYDKSVSPAMKRLYFDDLSAWPMEVIEAAMAAHRRSADSGRFFPKPADLIAQIQLFRAAGRLSKDEAWALAMGSFDEAATVCLTDEMLEAVAVAAPVWAVGDKVAARMAFKDAYERITGERRERGQAPVWTLSLGWDVERRATAAQEALRLGRMSAEQVQAHLPAPEPQVPAALVAGLLAGKVVAFPDSQGAVTRRRMAELRKAISGQARKDPERDVIAERETFEALKRSAVDALERMQAGSEAG